MNFDAILTAFINVLTPLNLIGLIFGVAVGIIIGALPGLSVNMGIALLFPLTFSFQGIGGILMLIVPDQAKAPTAEGKAAKES